MSLWLILRCISNVESVLRVLASCAVQLGRCWPRPMWSPNPHLLCKGSFFTAPYMPVCMNQDFISMPVTQTSPTSILAQSPLGPMLSAGCGRPANIRVANGLHFTGLVLMSLGTFAALSCIVLMYTACRSAVGHLLDRGLRLQTNNNNNTITGMVDRLPYSSHLSALS